ncbi:MAG: hypothetical protein H6836_08360 [Planctomycetes bacterium]|nr:hypothetical protein [Planctomycetota bacterium]
MIDTREAPQRRGVRLFSTLVAVQTLLCAVHVWFHLTWLGRKSVGATVHVWTDIRWDYGPQSWWSWFAMAAVGVAALRLRARRPAVERRRWTLMGCLFLYLALDDALMIHEAVGAILESRSKIAVCGWIVLMLPLFAAAGGYLFFFLLHTFASDRRGTRVLVLGYGALALSVALEVVEPRLVASGWTIRGFGAYEYTQVVEEYCEVLGPALLVLTLGRVPHVAPEP